MKELKIIGTTNINNTPITHIEGGFGENQKCILAKDVAIKHKQNIKEINRLINRNITEFIKDIDIIDLYDTNKDFVIDNNLMGSNHVKNVFLLSNSGYSKLYSFMRNKDEDIYEEMMNNYFNNDIDLYYYSLNREIRFRKILKDVMLPLNIHFVSQYNVDNKYKIDFYLPKYNLAIEYDERQHFTEANKLKDIERQRYIENKLGCNFVRCSYKNSYAYNIGLIFKTLNEYK